MDDDWVALNLRYFWTKFLIYYSILDEVSQAHRYSMMKAGEKIIRATVRWGETDLVRERTIRKVSSITTFDARNLTLALRRRF